MVQYLPSLLLPGIVGLITIPIVTRLFSAEIYGDYVLVLVTVSVLSTIVGWIATPIVRFYPAYKQGPKLSEFYGTVLKLTSITTAILSLFFLSALLFAKGQISINLYYLLSLGILLFILTACFGSLLEFLRARRQVNWYTAFTVWKSATAFGFGIILIMVFNYDIEGLLWGSVLSLGIAFPLLWKISIEKSPIKLNGISNQLASEMAKYGFPLMLANLATWILNLSDRYILGFFQDSHEVGIYSASYGISQSSILFLVSLFRVTGWPIAVDLWDNRGEEISKVFTSEVTRYYLIFCLPGVIGLSVLAKPVISVLTSPNYWEGYRVVPFVTLSAFLLGLAQRFWVGFGYHKKTHLVMFCTIAPGLLNVGLNFLLIPRYGYMAAAVTTFISYAFLLLLTVIISRRFFIWEFPFRSLAKVTCASAIMGVIVYYIGNSLTLSVSTNLILGTCMGILVYSAILFLLREFKPDEIQTLLALRGKFLS